VVGAAFAVGSWVGGHPASGFVFLVVMVVFSGALVVVSRRSETVRGLLDRRDERISSIDLRATAASGLVVIATVIGAAVVEMARGHSGEPYSWLGALAGLCYLLAVLIQRIRG
jgi:uncharacterized membrane protein